MKCFLCCMWLWKSTKSSDAAHVGNSSPPLSQDSSSRFSVLGPQSFPQVPLVFGDGESVTLLNTSATAQTGNSSYKHLVGKGFRKTSTVQTWWGHKVIGTKVREEIINYTRGEISDPKCTSLLSTVSFNIVRGPNHMHVWQTWQTLWRPAPCEVTARSQAGRARASLMALDTHLQATEMLPSVQFPHKRERLWVWESLL